MQHTRCGLTGVTDAELQARTGADIDFLTIDDHASTLRSDIHLIVDEGYLDPLRLIVGRCCSTWRASDRGEPGLTGKLRSRSTRVRSPH